MLLETSLLHESFVSFWPKAVHHALGAFGGFLLLKHVLLNLPLPEQVEDAGMERNAATLSRQAQNWCQIKQQEVPDMHHRLRELGYDEAH